MDNNEEKYSLWLRPAQAQIDEFMKIISSLAHNYQSVIFPPHITLLSTCSNDLNTIKQTCEYIVDQTQDFDIPLKIIDYSDTYYRNFFIPGELSSTLVYIYEIAKKELDYKPEEQYMPHVSLFYGKLDIELKRSLKEKLKGSYPQIFNCKRIDIFNSTGKAPDWYLIESYYFQS